jgi:hypothetical protein
MARAGHSDFKTTQGFVPRSRHGSHTAHDGAMLPPEGLTNREAAEAIAKVFGCSVEEAAKVLSLGIAVRIAEQNAARDVATPLVGRGRS